LCRLDSSATSTIFHFGKAKCYFEFKYFTAFSSIVPDSSCLCDLRRPAPHVFICSSDPSPLACSGAWPCQSKGRQTCGALPSPPSCHKPSHRHARGLGSKPT
jgi:hypothetical protein